METSIRALTMNFKATQEQKRDTLHLIHDSGVAERTPVMILWVCEHEKQETIKCKYIQEVIIYGDFKKI